MCHQEVALICDVIRWVKKVARRSDQMDYGGEKVRENVPLEEEEEEEERNFVDSDPPCV